MEKSVWDAIKENSKAERETSYDVNSKLIKATGLAYKENCTVFIFREPQKPKVDFYASKNKWWAHKEKKCYRGNAFEFLKWYDKQ